MKRILLIALALISGVCSAQTFKVQNLDVLGTSTLTGLASFTVRPQFNGNTPWDSGNLNPAIYAPLNSPVFTGAPWLSGAAGTQRVFFFTTVASPRWAILTDAAAETGSNAGSNFGIDAFNDAGSFISEPLIINRATGNTTFSGTVTAARFIGPLGNPLSVGTSLYPNITPAISTTATSTNGSTSITVTSAAGLANGMGIYSGFVSSCSSAITAFIGAYITNISGTTVTMSCPAVATNASPVAVQFGQNRYDATSALLVNDIGTETLKVGAVSQGNSAAWLNQISTGQDFRFTSALQVVPPVGGGYGITVGARSSDANSGAVAFPFQSLLYLDSWATTSYGSENVYLQDNLAAATAGKAIHIQMEQSIGSLWGSPPGEDPYTTNQVNQTIAHRYDCGTGQSSAPFPNNCTTAIDIVTNPQSFENGIVIANGAIDTGGGTRVGTAMSMPVNTGILWFSAASTFSASQYSPSAGVLDFSTPAGGSFNFITNGAEVFGIFAGAEYHKPTTFAAVTGSIACNSGNEGYSAGITDGNTAAFNATVAGGGANHVNMRCNGSNWVVF